MIQGYQLVSYIQTVTSAQSLPEIGPSLLIIPLALMGLLFFLIFLTSFVSLIALKNRQKLM